jgi:hypothetical protein
MAGYTRQSTGSIINGSPITAPPLNTEFNQLQAAFSATTGHSHDGSSGNSPKINLATSIVGFLPAEHGGIGGKNKLDATTTPVVSNDNTEGYAPGSLWENTTTGRIYICVGSATGAAVWRELLQVQNGNAVLPEATDTVDLGSNTVRFQDLFLSAGIAAAGNATIGGTMNITGATALGSTLGVTGDTTLVNLSATGTTVITSIDLNSGAIDSTTIGTTTPAAGTFTTLNANTSLVAATADINGGTVDGATIGASTPSTGAFTDLDASGTATLATVDINAGAIDGTVIGASSHTTGKFTTLQSTGQATLATVNIDGGTIDGATVGATTASSGAFTTLTASGGITGALTGNVTGNVTGSLSGGTVTGNVTGDLTGNVTAGSGSSSFNDVTISGTLNMDANSAATITNLSAPTNDNDAARKIDVDNAVANLVDSAPDSLNTLNELAAALADDDDAFNTLNTSIGTKLPKAGGTMTGAIAMSTNKITGVGDPTAAQDVSSKAYTDAQRDTRLATAGGTMSGEVAMGNNKITGLATPVASTDASSKGYVDGVLGSATVAATSATTATTQAGIATTKAGEAANSASAAAGSATTASTALSTFQNQYLGAQGSAPTADPDGSALDVGDLYFDTTAGAMKVYSANGWTNAGSSVNGTTNRYSYTATAGQTVFAATYDAGYVDVFLNGVKQVIGSTKDVTATTGTSIVFNSATSANDVVDIIGYGTFVLADHLTQTQSDARYVEVAGDTMTGNLSFGTGDKAIFGAGSDASIFSDGTSGYARGFVLQNTSGNKDVLTFVDGGATSLYHNNSAKLATTSTGIDVTGTVTSDGLTLSNADAPTIEVTDTTNTTTTVLKSGNNTGVIGTTTAHDLDIRSNNTDRLTVLSNGDISFYEDTGTTAKFFWDSSAERLAVGGTTTNATLHVHGNSVISNGNFFSIQSSSGLSPELDEASNGWAFTTNGTEAMRISSSGIIYINGDGTGGRISGDGTGGLVLQDGNGRQSFKILSPASGSSDAMTLDANGNLLVGNTDTDPYDNSSSSGGGIALRETGAIYNAVYQGTPVVSNRIGNDGGILQLRRDGVQLGIIGSNTGQLFIGYDNGSQDVGILFGDNTVNSRSIMPCRSDGSIVTDQINIGEAGGRWNSLFLSGGVYLGGTGSANKLDDYEEGDFQPYFSTTGNNGSISYSSQQGTYTKIGRRVFFWFDFTVSSWSGATGSPLISLPFTSSGTSEMGAFTPWDIHNNYTGSRTPTQWISQSSSWMRMYTWSGDTAMGHSPWAVNQTGRVSGSVSYTSS